MIGSFRYAPSAYRALAHARTVLLRGCGPLVEVGGGDTRFVTTL